MIIDSKDINRGNIANIYHVSGRALIKGKGKYQKKYNRNIITFDIETTPIPEIENAVMYVWMIQANEEDTIIGRTWEECKRIFNLIEEVSVDKITACYVHNLSYEFQFIKDYLQIEQVLTADARDIITATAGKIEFRCSYHLTMCKLEKFLKDEGVENQKLKMDYSIKRYPWTKLYDSEIAYCVNDVKGLRQAVIKLMQKYDDDVTTVPVTSTGYVRRECKEVMLNGKSKLAMPDLELLEALRNAFRGGNTHANRYNSNVTIRAEDIDAEIKSRDISSSYPSVMCQEKFPMQFIKRENADMRTIKNILSCPCKAILADITLYDIEIKDGVSVPYLTVGKAIEISKLNEEDDEYEDNGRVLKRKQARYVVTEIDLEIIMKQYDCKIQVNKLWSATKKALPNELIKLIYKHYDDKTALKGDEKRKADYDKSKTFINGIYGMSVQNPLKPHYAYDAKTNTNILENVSNENLYEDYMKTAFLPYQVGVWVAAYGRQRLQWAIDIIPPENFIYCDTDSTKYISEPEIEEEFEKLNSEIKEISHTAKDKKGNIHYMGIYEDETEKEQDKITAFRTLGAKKYAYVTKDGKLHVTISGVGKNDEFDDEGKLVKMGGATELGDIDKMQKGFIFKESAGLDKKYNDYTEKREYEIDGHEIRISSNVYLYQSTYTLGLAGDYVRMLNALSNREIWSYFGK